jgi:hypothetical protein
MEAFRVRGALKFWDKRHPDKPGIIAFKERGRKYWNVIIPDLEYYMSKAFSEEAKLMRKLFNLKGVAFFSHLPTSTTERIVKTFEFKGPVVPMKP